MNNNRKIGSECPSDDSQMKLYSECLDQWQPLGKPALTAVIREGQDGLDDFGCLLNMEAQVFSVARLAYYHLWLIS